MFRRERRRRRLRVEMAQQARDEADRHHEEAVRRWPEVEAVVEPLRQARLRNHFAELFEALGGKGE